MKNSTSRPGSMNELLKRKIERRRAEVAQLVNASYEQIDAGWTQLEADCRQRSDAGRNTIIADMDRAFDWIGRRDRSLERNRVGVLLLGGFLICLGAAAAVLWMDRFDVRIQTGKAVLAGGFSAGANETHVWIWLPETAAVRREEAGERFVAVEK